MIPFSGGSNPGIVPDSKTFHMIVENTPEDAILIFDRGYNSFENIGKIRERRYMGSLVLSALLISTAVYLEGGFVH